MIKVLRKKIRKRKNKSLTETLVLSLIVGLILALGLLAGCSKSTVCPDQTKIEVGVTETDAKNDKFQEKKLLTQTFKWGKKKCNDG